jgi:translation initiation factor IF-2
MKKIRINELARELEVKPGVILDLLPELGVQEKKTHSSSIDEDVAITLRDRLVSSGIPRNGSANREDDFDYDAHSDEDEGDEHEHDNTRAVTAVAEDVHPPAVAETAAVSAPAMPTPPVSAPEGTRAPIGAPIRPPVGVYSRAPSLPRPEPSRPGPGQAEGKVAPSQPPAQAAAAPAAVPDAVAETEQRPKFQPLRPPLGASGMHSPLASAGPHPHPGPASRSVPIPARPIAPSIQRPPTASATPGLPPSGPRQPLPPEPQRHTFSPSERLSSERPARPVSGPGVPVATPVSPAPATPLQQPRAPQAPTHMMTPGAAASTSAASTPSVPGAPAPPRPITPRPSGSTLTPGAPIAPRPPGGRPPLAGQPPARMVVPPRPDLVQRLKQQQAQPRPGIAAAPPPAPRPGAPRPLSPAPGQPLYRGPIRPGQPLMRGPAGPGGPGQQRRPGMRPMHPTTPLRPEQATPIPTEQQRRHQAKPGTRQGVRKREDVEEGNLRERGPKRHAIVERPPIDREITVAEGVTIKELSEKLGVKANLVIKKLVETKKVFATINQTLDVKLAEELAREFGASTNQVSYEEESTQDLELTTEPVDMVRRAPVVTIMGHVDHGKTSLLDAIRETNVAGREAGGITQHIGAYSIEKNNRKIVFIDTPGHQAFTRMRARGAKVTDIVVLVVSADDGVMPQTLEAIDHARAAKVPMLVAINKIDKPGAQPDRVKQQLSDRGMLAEDWGGDVVMVPVSAKTGTNLDLLLEMILLVADMLDLKASPTRPALGTVLEAKLDRGRGPVATVLVRNGTLRAGDFLICGALFSKVRAMFDDRGNSVKEAEPSTPVEIIGLDSLPEVGDSFQVVSDTSKAKQIVIYRELKAREAAMARGARVATLDSLARQFKEGDLKDLNLIVKADVGGTAEVLSDTLQQLSNDKVRVRVLRTGVGAITEDDVLLASASEAMIIGFNVKPERNAQATAEQQKVEIRQHSIIYELIDDAQRAMTGMLEPTYKETIQGHAEVRDTFKISKIGTIAGCYVSDGAIRRDSQVRIMRDGDVIHTGKIESLKRFKNDASEVKNGLECGISIVNFNNIQTGDTIEAFAMERVAVEVPVSR